MEYKLEQDSHGYYYVSELKYSGASKSMQVLLFVRYKDGDMDLIRENNERMHECLYDLYQTNEHLKDGDTFTINGEVVYRCEGVHVVKID